jgi:1-deoxy-D-xylulose-5-phosphate synthase
MQENDLLLIAIGQSCQTAFKVGEILSSKGITVTIINPSFIKPLDFERFSHYLSTHRFVATIDEYTLKGGLGALINNFLIQSRIREAAVLNFGIPDMWVQFGSNIELMQELGLDAESIAERILQEFFVHDNCTFSERKEAAFV